MKIEVRYYSQTGNTKKLAEAAASELGAQPKDVSVPLNEKADLLFLCNSVYWGGIDKHVKYFIKENAANIGILVNISSAALIESTYKQIKKVASDAGVTLCDKEFHCRGKFAALHGGHPDDKDIAGVKEFVRSLIK